MSKLNINLNNLLLFLILLCLIGNFAGGYYHKGYYDAIELKPTHEDYHTMLFFKHMEISFCLAVCLLSLWLDRLISNVIALLTLLITLCQYIWWYYEKYYFLKNWKYVPGSPEYESALQKLGMFRGGTEWDFYSFILVVLLIVGVSIEVWKKIKTSNLARLS